MYVPFVVTAGTIIKNEKATDIKVSTGKVIDDGTKTIVVGMAMPGLQESLNLSTSDVDIPDSIEITMNAVDFETESIISYVTPKVLEESDLDIFNKMDELYSKTATLQDSMNQIEEGANTLAEGTQTLTEGTTQLKEGTVSAYNGANKISSEVNKSINSLAQNKSDALDEKTLKAIESQAASGSILTEEQKNKIIIAADQGIEAQADTIKEQFVASAKQVAEETALQTALTVAQTTAKQTAVETAKQVAKLTAKQTAMETAKTLNPNLTEEQLQAIGNSAASKVTLSQAQLEQIEKEAVNSATLTDAQKKQIKAQADMGIEAKRETIEKQGIASAKAIAERTAITSAQAGATEAAKVTATSVASQVGNQVKSEASKQVISQMKTLSNGLSQLTEGLSTLNTGAEALESGATELQSGAETLATGISTYNEEGIKQICNFIQVNTKNLTNRIEKLTELSKEYNNFTMLDGKNSGNVKFIMIVDAIKKQEESEQSKEEIIINDNKISE